MRIGIDVRVADPEEPGQQRYLWRLGVWLAGEGHHVHFLTVRPQPETIACPEGVTLHRLHDLSRARLRDAVRGLHLDVLLLNPERSRRYRGIGANVLRSAYGTEHYRQKLRSFRNPLERAVRASVRLTPWEAAERRWERAFYEGTSPEPHVVAQSRYMRGEILGSYAVPEGNVHVVHNAVDTNEFTVSAREGLRDEMRARWRIPGEATCLLFLGHNYRLKGLWQLLDVLADSDPSVHLLVVGRGTGSGQRREARRRIERLGLRGRVTMAGPVRPSLHALAAADALIHLSWHDSFGFVALEAMACGLPVITTPYVGATELIDDGVSGLVVDPSDDRGIAAAIDRTRDAAFRRAMGAAAAAVGRSHDETSNFRRVLEVMRAAAVARDGPV
jgi:UDP-glucose:(heptosyl)LPS alpha-1,3-glucosyltransferase